MSSSARVASPRAIPGSPSGYSGMVDHQGGRTGGERLDLLIGEGEPHVVHRRGGGFTGQVGLVLASGTDGTRPAPSPLPMGLDGPFDADQSRQPRAQVLVGGELDEQRGRQLAGAGEESVVHVELVLDL